MTPSDPQRGAQTDPFTSTAPDWCARRQGAAGAAGERAFAAAVARQAPVLMLIGAGAPRLAEPT